jgi:Ca2+-binding RTX toxin-like protein
MSKTRVGILLAAAFLSGALLSARTQHTFASFSDFQETQSEAKAGVWASDPPAACGPIGKYDGVVYGTPGDDVLSGGNHPQIIMGLAGNDVIHAGNSGDCIVGGDGDDQLYGDNAKDTIIGGDGDDLLDGGNGKDDLDGGPGLADVCIGGNGHDTITDCEVTP